MVVDWRELSHVQSMVEKDKSVSQSTTSGQRAKPISHFYLHNKKVTSTKKRHENMQLQIVDKPQSVIALHAILSLANSKLQAASAGYKTTHEQNLDHRGIAIEKFTYHNMH